MRARVRRGISVHANARRSLEGHTHVTNAERDALADPQSLSDELNEL
jgi:hypothetical protein